MTRYSIALAASDSSNASQKLRLGTRAADASLAWLRGCDFSLGGYVLVSARVEFSPVDGR